jgi:hypothetical protein
VKGFASTFCSFAGEEGRSHHPRERFLELMGATIKSVEDLR